MKIGPTFSYQFQQAYDPRPGDFASKIQARIEDMSDQTFVRLACDDKFYQAGSLLADTPGIDYKACYSRASELATDPAKGNKITDGGIEEAAVAFTAEHLHIFEHATRELSGSAEFIDEKGISWDVKSPLSPPEPGKWTYSATHQLEKVRHDLSQGDRVLFNLSRVNDTDRDQTLKLFTEELDCSERSRIVILTDPEVLGEGYLAASK